MTWGKGDEWIIPCLQTLQRMRAHQWNTARPGHSMETTGSIAFKPSNGVITELTRFRFPMTEDVAPCFAWKSRGFCWPQAFVIFRWRVTRARSAWYSKVDDGLTGDSWRWRRWKPCTRIRIRGREISRLITVAPCYCYARKPFSLTVSRSNLFVRRQNVVQQACWYGAIPAPSRLRIARAQSSVWSTPESIFRTSKSLTLTGELAKKSVNFGKIRNKINSGAPYCYNCQG